MKVYCYPANEGSKYIPLLFVGTLDRYQPVYRQQAGLGDAIAALEAGCAIIVHVHWEEFVLDDCANEAKADAQARSFVGQIRLIRKLGGILVWTVHNELPHESPFHAPFLTMRAALAEHATIILVHNQFSIGVLARQVALDRVKVSVLPHPSYSDWHEDAGALAAGLAQGTERRIQAFGWIRRQKGLGEMIGMLPEPFLVERGLRIRISGDGPEANAVREEQANRDDVEWDIRHVPDDDVPRLLRSSTCVVLPYERVLTSGVAMLAMSVGAMLVAVDIPQLRETLPPEAQQFLYPRGEGAALRRAIDDVLGLDPGRRRAIIEGNLAAARSATPAIISSRLAALYDRAVQQQA